MGATAERSQSLDRRGPQNMLMVQRRCRCAQERTNPENPLVIPGLLVAVDHRSAETPRRVDTSAGYRNRRQVNHKNRKPYWKRSQNRHMRIAGVSFGVSCRKNGVNQNEGTNDLRSETNTLGITISNDVSSATVAVIVRCLEGLNQTGSADCAKTLSYNIQNCSGKRHFLGQKQSERNRGVYVTSRDAGCAVNEDEYHAAEGPGYTQNADAHAAGFVA
eukprot:TRINITY_DN3858_c0_g1_i1.p2 TRINITY_DN3858_c0_g1~~TRINITY_DN3858_c0_g1_i1.p2  ORF type:complete len:218 (-),score=-17.16 TRINITY_DN3858_c0_g1_i1:266-919(-)